MSIVDNNLYMSDAQALTATAASTKSLDMATATRNVGGGEPIELVVQIATTMGTGGTSNLTVALQDSADNSSFTTVLTGAVAVSSTVLVAGYELLRVRLPAGLRRYIQVLYTVAGGSDFNAGAINAYLVLDRQDNVARPSGFSVL